MKLKKGQEVSVKIEKLVFGGRGIGEHEGLKIFVDDVIPGDRALVKLLKVKSSFAEAGLVKVTEPSKDRIAARCKHFDTCGGCTWQYLPYKKQLDAKEQQVKDAIERIGGLPATVVQPIVACEDEWFYRNKMELSFGTAADGSVMLGFYPPGFHYEVFDLEECFLESTALAAIAKKVRDFANEYEVAPMNKKTQEGLLRNLIIREGKNTGERMVILVTTPAAFDALSKFKRLFEKDKSVTSLYWIRVYQIPGKRTWTEAEHLAGKESLTEKIHLENGHELTFEILPEAFFQTNTKQAEKLYSLALEAASLSGSETVLDLYSGTGTIGLFCAHKAKKIIGIEMNPDGVESALQNAKLNGIENAEFVLGRVEDQLKGLKGKPDVVMVDPPRNGLGPEVVETVSAFGAPRVIYVSCNPATLARDLKQFEELGYETETITPVDMFPQTAHIECVARLSRQAK